MSRGDKLRARVIFPNVRIDVRREGERGKRSNEEVCVRSTTEIAAGQTHRPRALIGCNQNMLRGAHQTLRVRHEPAHTPSSNISLSSLPSLAPHSRSLRLKFHVSLLPLAGFVLSDQLVCPTAFLGTSLSGFSPSLSENRSRPGK